MKLNVITLFSGYDSQCLALDRIKRHNPQFDYDLVAWSEIDPNAIKAHNALFPQWQDRNLGDISKVDWQAQAAALGCKVDLLTYSSPCQDFSSAGLQKGGQQGSGTRSSLLWECERAIEQLRPKYLLFENVSALVSEKFRPTFFKWCLTLEKLGYTNHYQLMNAKDYGVPQNRLRVFMVSILGEHAPYYFPKPFPLEKRLKDVLETNVPDRYYLSQERLAGLQIFNEEREKKGQGFRFEPLSDKADTSRCEDTTAGQRPCDTYMQEPCVYANPHGYYEGGEYHETSPAVRSSAFQANTAVAEPLPAAARGRAAGDWHTSQHNQTLELGDPAAANSVTSVAKDSMIVEPIIASMKSRDKDNPTGVRTANNGNFAQRLEPSADQSTSNTITSVAKDNLIAEPTIIEDFYPDRPARVYEEQAPTIRSDRTGLKVSEPAVLGWTRSGDSKGKPTYHPVKVANCVTAAKRDNTQNYVVEPQVQQVCNLIGDREGKFANPQRGRIDSPAGLAPTVNTAQGGNLVAKIIKPTRQDLIQYHLTDDGNLRAYIDDEKKTGVSELQITNPDNPAPTLTGANHAKVWQSIEELIEQAKTAHPSRGIILIKNTPCWVRRLTERELFRLMDVDEPNIDTLLNAGISNTQLAKLAGNSIVTACMYYIFHALYIETTPPPNTQTQLF